MRGILSKKDPKKKGPQEGPSGTSSIRKPEERLADKPSSIEVVLVDPLNTVRAGLELLIRSEPHVRVIAEASTADEAVADLKEYGKPTGVVVLVGLSCSGEHDSFWLIRQLREQFPPVKIVAIGANSDVGTISRAFFTGADGFIDKNAGPEDFVDGIRRSAAGDVVMIGPPMDWIGSIAEEVDRRKQNGSVLTGREQEVITLAAEGLTAKDMGHRLGLSERTITTHLQRIYSKLGVSSRVAAIQAASSQHLISVRESG